MAVVQEMPTQFTKIATTVIPEKTPIIVTSYSKHIKPSSCPTSANSDITYSDIKDTLLTESEKDSKCEGCLPVATSKPASDPDDWSYLHPWCTCGNVWKNGVSKKRGKRTKASTTAGTGGGGQATRASQESVSQNRANFQHYEDINLYMEEYRIRMCMSAKRTYGQWFSITGLTSTGARHRDNQPQQSHAPMNVYRQSQEHRKITAESKQGHDYNEEALAQAGGDIPVSLTQTATTTVKTRTLPVITTSPYKVSHDAPETNHATPVRTSSKTSSKCSIKQEATNVTKDNGALPKPKRGCLSGQSPLIDDRDRHSWAAGETDIGHLTDLESRSSHTQHGKNRQTKPTNEDGAAGISPAFKLSHQNSGKPNIAYVFSNQGGVDEGVGTRLPRLEAWISESQSMNNAHHKSESNNNQDVSPTDDDTCKNSTSSLPHIGPKLLNDSADMPNVIGGSKHIYHKIKRAMSTMELKAKRRNSRAKQVRVVSDPKGVITKVEVNGPAQKPSTIGEDAANATRRRLRKLGTSRSGTWESFHFRS